jgi:hypothetical protein
MDGAKVQVFETWASIELFGHQRIAGLVTEQTVAGAGFIRVDVPETKFSPAHTKLFSPSAIYSITPTGEKEARAIAEYLHQKPIEPYMLAAIAAPVVPGQADPQVFGGVFSGSADGGDEAGHSDIKIEGDGRPPF